MCGASSASTLRSLPLLELPSCWPRALACLERRGRKRQRHRCSQAVSCRVTTSSQPSLPAHSAPCADLIVEQIGDGLGRRLQAGNVAIRDPRSTFSIVAGPRNNVSQNSLWQFQKRYPTVVLPEFDEAAIPKTFSLPLRFVVIRASQIEGRPNLTMLPQVRAIQRHHGSPSGTSLA